MTERNKSSHNSSSQERSATDKQLKAIDSMTIKVNELTRMVYDAHLLFACYCVHNDEAGEEMGIIHFQNFAQRDPDPKMVELLRIIKDYMDKNFAGLSTERTIH